MTREEVYKGLEQADAYFRSSFDAMYGTFACEKFREWVDAIEQALVLLKGSFTPQQVYDTVIEHAQHDMRFKLGDKIDYSFTDVVYILNMELMCKAGDM